MLNSFDLTCVLQKLFNVLQKGWRCNWSRLAKEFRIGEKVQALFELFCSCCGMAWMRGERIGMIVRDGGIVVECPCNQFFISLERVIRSSSVLLSWRWVAMVMFAFFLVPMVLGFGVLVIVWALEFVGVAMVIVGSLRVEGMAPLCWEVEGCVCTLWVMWHLSLLCRKLLVGVTLNWWGRSWSDLSIVAWSIRRHRCGWLEVQEVLVVPKG